MNVKIGFQITLTIHKRRLVDVHLSEESIVQYIIDQKPIDLISTFLLFLRDEHQHLWIVQSPPALRISCFSVFKLGVFLVDNWYSQCNYDYRIYITH